MTLIASLFEALCDFLFVSSSSSPPSLFLYFTLLILLLFPLHFREKRLTVIFITMAFIFPYSLFLVQT